jgi:hypothetical protein
MADDVSTIVYEIRRLARDFPGEPAPPEIVPTAGGFSLVDTSKAAVLRLSVPQRYLLALAARGYTDGQIAGLTASTISQTRERLGAAATDLGLTPCLAAAFGSAEPAE